MNLKSNFLTTIFICSIAFVAITSVQFPFGIDIEIRFGYVAIVVIAIVTGFMLNHQNPISETVYIFLVSVLFALALTALWNNALSQEYALLGGWLPSTHSISYYLDAVRLLEGERFSPISSHRPIFSGALAILLKLTHHDIKLINAIFALTACLAVIVLARTTRTTSGAVCASVLTCLLLLYYRAHSGTLMTENLGFLVGVLGFCLLWQAVYTSSRNLFIVGLFVVAIGLNVRAGAMFLLPILIIWGGFHFGQARGFPVRFLIMCTGAVVLAFLVNYLQFKLLGSHEGIVFSNSAFLIYGLVKGGQSWDKIFLEFPEYWATAHTLTTTKEIYWLAWNAFLENPAALLTGLITTWKNYLSPTSTGVAGFVQPWLDSQKYLAYGIRITLYVSYFTGIVFCLFRYKIALCQLLLVMNIGVLLSIPFINADIGRILAATMPVTLMTMATGISYFFKILNVDILKFENKSIRSPVALVFSVVVCVVISLGPVFISIGSRAKTYEKFDCADNLEPAAVRLYPNAGMQLVTGLESGLSKTPQVLLADFESGLEYAALPIRNRYRDIRDPTAIFPARNLIEKGENLMILYNQSIETNDPVFVEICGTRSNSMFIVDHVRAKIVEGK